LIMEQFSVRLNDEHGRAVRRLAAARGRSINQTFEDLVAAATDPALAGDELAALRERLSRAGLVFDVSALPSVVAPTDDELQRARSAAGRGTPLSDLVSEGRG
jgi:predicted transcriptional regulator